MAVDSPPYTLYHYCSTATFLAILSGPSIRLSLLTLSNDTMEGRLVAKTLLRMANRDGLDAESLRAIEGTVSLLEWASGGLGFCLSKEGDLLSQWRGYAANATGFSIGFSTQYLSLLSKHSIDQAPSTVPFILDEVKYTEEDHDSALREVYYKIRDICSNNKLTLETFCGNDSYGGDFKTQPICMELLDSIFNLNSELFTLKSPAFKEEREWRLLSSYKPDLTSCRYHALGDRVVPYREYTLESLNLEPVVKVVIGPKNLTPPEIVTNFLMERGFNNVEVTRSTASYR